MFYFNKEEKDEHDFFISYSQFSCLLNGSVNSKLAHAPGHFSGVYHLVGPGGGEFVQKTWSIDDRKGRGKN